jgi:hypothetical protein
MTTQTAPSQLPLFSLAPAMDTKRGDMRIALVIALAALCGACATVIRGTTDGVGFNSTPSGAEVHTSNGMGCVTPCTLVIKKE